MKSKGLSNNINVMDESSLEEVLGEFLVKNNLTIATAESCTGGMVAAKLINYPGISSSFIEGIVCYSNESKISRLGVKEQTLKSFGAVSHEVAEEMAVGIAKTSGAHIGISTTGVAGPGGGTEEKPVGLVYIGMCYKGEVITRELRFNGNRQEIREETTSTLLDMVTQELLYKRD
jgi:PncC family amidohydrolase